MHNSEAADLQEMPKNRPILWVLDAHSMGNECPLLVLSMPDTWSMSAHLIVSDSRLMVSDRPPYVLLFLIQLVNLSSYS